MCQLIKRSKVQHINGLVQERHNSSALAMELCLSCTNQSICTYVSNQDCIKTLMKSLHIWCLAASSILHLQDHLQILIESCVQSSRLSDVIWRHWIWSGLVQQWFVTCHVPSNYINQCWIVINWSLRNKLYFNFIDQVQIISFKGMHLKMLSAKCCFFVC